MGSLPMKARGVGQMQVRQLKIGDFWREALSTWLGRKLITLSIHLICLQHFCRDAACQVGLSATADTSSSACASLVHSFASRMPSVTQPTVSKHWRELSALTPLRENHPLHLIHSWATRWLPRKWRFFLSDSILFAVLPVGELVLWQIHWSHVV